MKPLKVAKVVCIDGYCGRLSRRALKRAKSRVERRRARANPQCAPSYGKYQGWAT